MTMQETLEQQVRNALPVSFLEIVNESDSHSGPPGRESHFRLVVVSPAFEGMSLVRRHQRVYAAVAGQLAGGVHALALHTYTEGEWAARGSAPASPDCRGGSRH